MFSVDTLLSVFAFLVKQLKKTAYAQERTVDRVQVAIDRLSVAKKTALDEAARAHRAAEKISSLLT